MRLQNRRGRVILRAHLRESGMDFLFGEAAKKLVVHLSCHPHSDAMGPL